MTKKEYLTKMVEECLDVKVTDYDGSSNPVQLTATFNNAGWDIIMVQVQNHYGLALSIWTVGGTEFDPEGAQKLEDWMTQHGAKIQNTVSYINCLTFKCEKYPWQCWTEHKTEEHPKTKSEPFKPGTKVRFTQEAKDRFNDSEYWHYANGDNVQVRLNETFTVESYSPGNWPGYHFLKKPGTEPLNYRFANYLLEEVPEEKAKPEPKREVAEIIRLREENKELKAKIQELEAKLSLAKLILLL